MTKIWDNIPEIKEEILEVNKIIDKNLKTKNTKTIEDVINQLLKSKGKGVRAGLLISAAKLGEYNKDKILPLAAALEMIHLATLVHDDVIDDAPDRRGVKSIQSRFGKNSAVYTGDFIFAKAYKLMIGKFDLEENKISNSMEKICLGEVLQNESKFNVNITVRDYLRIISGKTAAMFGLAMYAGANESGLNNFQSRTVGYSGYYVGMAFQIIDDCMDYTKNKDNIGKDTKVDIIKGIYTLPLIYALKRDNNDNIKAIINKNSIDDEDIKKIIYYTKRYSGIKEAMSLAGKYTDKSKKLIDTIGNNHNTKRIKDIFEILINRNY